MVSLSLVSVKEKVIGNLKTISEDNVFNDAPVFCQIGRPIRVCNGSDVFSLPSCFPPVSIRSDGAVRGGQADMLLHPTQFCILRFFITVN